MTVPFAERKQPSPEGGAWLDSVVRHLFLDDRRQACTALRATLHALRDQLDVTQAAHFGGQLPPDIRRLYLEGWRLSPTSGNDPYLKDFCSHIGDELTPDFPLDARNIAKGVFDVLSERLDRDEVGSLIETLPAPLQALWPKTGHAFSRTRSAANTHSGTLLH